MEPQTIKDYPLPTLDTSQDSVTASADGSTPTIESQNGLSPSVIPNAPFRQPVVAVETISDSLNTQSRQILGTFTFGEVGALKIGNYVNGVSGELDLTPNGITAKNVNGVTTFSVDGTTGNATFLGTIQAGTVISGHIIVGGAANGDGIIQVVDALNNVVVQLDNTGITIYNGSLTIQDANGLTVIDAVGVKSTTQFVNGSISQATQQNTTSTSFVDVPGTTVTFSLDRLANVLIMIDATGLNAGNNTGGDNCIAILNIDGSDQSKQMSLPGMLTDNLSLVGITSSLTFLVQLGAGSHTIKMRFRSANGNQARIINATVTYNVLGK